MLMDAPFRAASCKLEKLRSACSTRFNKSAEEASCKLRNPSWLGKRRVMSFLWEFIVTRRHWGVGGEYTLAANFRDVLTLNGGAACFGGFLIEKFEGEESGVAFVHVVPGEFGVAQSIKHSYAADAQNHFLTQAIVGIAAVKRAGQFAVAGIVGIQI